MSTDQCRTQVANIQNSIAKLQGEKAKKVDAAAKAGKKNHDAQPQQHAHLRLRPPLLNSEGDNVRQ